MKKIIKVDAELAGFTPDYIKNRLAEAAMIPALAEAGAFAELWTIAHKMHGSGGGFGLEQVSEIGARMEKSAKAADKAALCALAAELKEFLDSIVVEYVVPG